MPELVEQLRQARPDVVVLGDGTGRVGRGLRSLAPCPVLVVREPHERGPQVVMSPPTVAGAWRTTRPSRSSSCREAHLSWTGSTRRP